MIGQPLYILDTVDSTNNYAMEQVNTGQVTPGTAWFAMEQTAGKGQRGKQWSSPPGENLMLSIALQPGMLPLSRQFMLSVVISLSAHDWFSKYAGDETAIKWSNDLYWRDRKAGGILIENVLRGTTWQYAIMGIGVNLNQTTFPPHLTNPVSLKQITGKDWDPIELTRTLCACLEERMQLLHPAHYNTLLEEYKSKLFRFNKAGTYRMNGELFEGIIRDVLPDGKLCLEKDGEILELGFGEVEFVIVK
ncbi:biotin--[acetyl-CoA-carboxylase] ligase [Chitinophaga pinensis]|uniref:Biotin--[acetyl-CoA-carboxylase] ligase n=1 Tax=Chitinophaga pinensis TaxID=79329 RepID=A0A5C6LWZ3_9BACT|nr:biotin--[acetyl-CoA-carboxylase] ligase [Chitinophaga pinensis]TWW01751.1 biotin--[acetyl-CoA-carboxylase] ligase [Chitinophaga pinensis]